MIQPLDTGPFFLPVKKKNLRLGTKLYGNFMEIAI